MLGQLVLGLMPIPLAVQWHITNQCGNRCRHCYMSGSEGDTDNTTLTTRNLLRVFDRLLEFEHAYNARFTHFTITGGDPLLREDWPKLVSLLHKHKRKVGMMVNPETLTPENLKKLTDNGIRHLQLSLDGRQNVHDKFRAKGSFFRTIGAIERLSDYGMSAHVMFTLFPENRLELVPLLRFIAEETSACAFNFDVGCFTGNATGLDQGITPAELHRLLDLYLDEKERLFKCGHRLRIGEKTNLMKPARHNRTEFHPIQSKTPHVFSGCLCGWKGICILSNGSALACRRLPLKIGKLPDQSFEEIFLGNSLMRQFRRPRSFKDCGKCDFYSVCRGCPAATHSLTQDCFSKNPLCFREKMDKQPGPAGSPDKNRPPSLPMDASNKEEWELVAAYNTWRQKAEDEIVSRPELASLFLALTRQPELKQKFMAAPFDMAADRGITLPREVAAYLVDLLSQTREDAKTRENIEKRVALGSTISVLDKIFM